MTICGGSDEEDNGDDDKELFRGEPFMAVGRGPGSLPQLGAQSASPSGAGPKCQECRVAERSEMLSSLSTGWLGPFWGCSVAQAGAAGGTASGGHRTPPLWALPVIDT